MNVLLDRSARPVVGHRGNRAHAPENTIESFAQAVAAGADAIEFDVRLSSDGVPVIMHDATVSRTTNGTGAINEMPFERIRALDAGSRFTPDKGATFPYRDKGHRIPSLDEVLEAFPATPLLIEIKTVQAALAARRAIEAHNAEERCLVDSLEDGAVRAFADSRIAIGAARNDVLRAIFELTFGLPVTPFSYRALCVPPNYKGVPIPVLRLAREAAEQGCVLHVWTVNQPDEASHFWRNGVQGIITDDPALMVKTRTRSSSRGL
jgi:glycerophosphoryl diester phosphodiesterase